MVAAFRPTHLLTVPLRLLRHEVDSLAMWRALVSATGFLTRLPVPNVALVEADVARGAGFFAWVGALIASLLLLAQLALLPLGPSVCAMCIVAAWAWLTGALHLDGLADTVDGLSGGRGDRERTLAIMRDSRIGAHGAVALFIVLALKWAALEQLFRASNPLWLAAPVVARFVCTALLALFSYAREQGLGSAFAGRVGLAEVMIGFAVFIPIGAWLGPHLPLVAFAALAGAACAFLVALKARAHLGGLTGDVHGAAIEVCEVGMLLALGWSPPWA